MASAPVFVGTPKTWFAQVSAANTNRDGSGTIVDLVTAGANGSRIDEVEIEAAGTVTAGVIRLYLYDGTNTRLFKERLVSATTPSTTVKVWEDVVTFLNGLNLPPGATWKLRVSTHNAETFNIFARGGDL
jgi:hypothetical protein